MGTTVRHVAGIESRSRGEALHIYRFNDFRKMVRRGGVLSIHIPSLALVSGLMPLANFESYLFYFS